MYMTHFGDDQFVASIIDPAENVSIFYRKEKSFSWLWCRNRCGVAYRAFLLYLTWWFKMTTSLEEPSKKTSRPQLVVLNRAFKLAKEWVNSMGDSPDDAKPNEIVLESRSLR